MRQTVIFAELVLLYLANMENREQQTFISISQLAITKTLVIIITSIFTQPILSLLSNWRRCHLGDIPRVDCLKTD